MNVHQRILVIMAAPTLMEATSVDAPLDTTEPAKGIVCPALDSTEASIYLLL